MGRPENSFSGPRPVYWNCVAIVNDELVVEEICSPKMNNLPDLKTISIDEKEKLYEEIKNFAIYEAADIFEKKHGKPPMDIKGPYNLFKGQVNGKKSSSTRAKSSNQDSTLTVSDTLEFSGEQFMAQYNGWFGTAHRIKNNEDSAIFIYSKPVSGENKNPPAMSVIKLDNLKKIEAITE